MCMSDVVARYSRPELVGFPPVNLQALIFGSLAAIVAFPATVLTYALYCHAIL